MKQTAIYARVSTTDQQPRTQLRELRAYAKRRGLRVVDEFVDREGGAKASRPQLNRLMGFARKRQLDVVLVWKFDRFARSSQQLINALEEFRGLDVDFISYTENGCRQDDHGRPLAAFGRSWPANFTITSHLPRAPRLTPASPGAVSNGYRAFFL